jgi:drug/metabolite transporter (DMT)-like permease
MNISVRLQIWLSFLVLTLAWGSSFILVKRGLEAFTPLQVASIRLVSAAAVLSFWGFSNLKHIPKGQLKFVIGSGILSMGVPAFLFSMAQVGLKSSIVGVLNALTPAFAFIIGILFFKQKSKFMQVVGLLFGFFGSVLLILEKENGGFSLNGYAGFVVLATLCYGLNVNMIKRYLPDLKPIYLSSVAVLASGLLALPYLLSTNWLDVVANNPKGMQSLAAAVTLGCVGTAFAQVVFNNMLQQSSAVFASSITYFIPIVAVMWGVWDGEMLTFWHYLGIACLIVGIIILNKFR